jgi:hypothetical protein
MKTPRILQAIHPFALGLIVMAGSYFLIVAR